MSQEILRQLSVLQADSRQHLPTSIIYGFSSSPGGTVQLIRIERDGGRYVGVPKHGAATVLQNLRSRVKVFTLDASKQGFATSLNTSLKGGSSNPVLTAVLGTAAGVVSGGAGLLFSAMTLGVDLSRRDTDVLTRLGDEIWHVEEIGKVMENNALSANRYVATHISSYFLVDPFRGAGQTNVKGWLLHESRTEVLLR